MRPGRPNHPVPMQKLVFNRKITRGTGSDLTSCSRLTGGRPGCSATPRSKVLLKIKPNCSNFGDQKLQLDQQQQLVSNYDWVENFASRTCQSRLPTMDLSFSTTETISSFCRYHYCSPLAPCLSASACRTIDGQTRESLAIICQSSL